MSYGYAQPLVENSTGNDNTTTVTSTKFTANNSAGNLIFAAAMFDGNGTASKTPSSITISDTRGNTYLLLKALTDSTNTWMSAIFYAKNIAASTVGTQDNALTATFNGMGAGDSFYKGVMGAEYSGLSSATPYVTGECNGDSQRPDPGTTDGIISGFTPTLSGQPCAVIGFSTTLHETNDQPNAGTGFTDRGQCWQFGTGWYFARLEDKRVTSTAAVEATFTPRYLSSPQNYDTYVVAFHEPSGATLAGTPSDATTGAGKLNSDFVASLADTTTASASLFPWPASQASDTTTLQGSISTAIRLAAAAVDATSVSAQLGSWASVVLASPLYAGIGSILDPNGAWSNGAPGAGATVYYDPTNMSVLSNGEFVATSTGFSAVCQWNNAGTWSYLTVVVTPGFVSYPAAVAQGIGAMSTAILLGSAATDLTTAAAAFSSQINLSGALQLLSSVTASLTTAIQAVAAAADSSTASGTLTGTANSLAGVASDYVTLSALISTQIQMLGAAVSVVAAAGNLATQLRLAANALSFTSASASLSTSVQQQAQASDTTASAGILSTGIQASAAAVTIASGAAQLLTVIQAQAAAVTTSSVQGQLGGQTRFASAAATISNAIAALTTLIQLVGSAQTTSSAQGSLTTQTRFAGAASDSSTAAGKLSTQASVDANASDTSSAGGSLQTGVALAGAASDETAAGADLFTSIDPDANATDESTATGALSAAGSDYIHADVMLVAPPEGFWPADGLLPWGLRFQRVGEMLIYAIDWSEWLANRWLPRAKVVLGDVVRPTRGATVECLCVQGGYTGYREPKWPENEGAQLLDGNAVWQIQPLTGDSLGTSIKSATWSASSPVVGITNARTVNGVLAVVSIDTVNALAGADYDVACQIMTSDQRQKIGKFRIKVR